MANHHKVSRPAVVAAVALSASVGLLCSIGCSSSKVLGDQVNVGASAGLPSCGGDAGVGKMGPGLPQFQPQLATTVSAADPPPPLSGGTLLVLRDGHTAVASDPDRDQVWIVDLSRWTLTASVALAVHDEPGRLVEDGAGRVHVILRRGGALITLDPQSGTLLARRPVCAVPRGVAYDSTRDLVYVACMGGELVSLPAAGGTAVRTLTLPSDLRDVVMDGDNLLISRFRAADVLVVDAGTGQLSATLTLPPFSNPSARQMASFTPSTAWRMLPGPGGGAVILHQRGVTGPIVAGPGGYGDDSSPGSCDAIVHAAMTPIKVGQALPPPSTPPIAGMVLAVDLAFSADGSKTAIIAAGNSRNPQLPRLFVANTADLTSNISPSDQFSCGQNGGQAPGGPGTGFGGAGGTTFVNDAGPANSLAPDAGAPNNSASDGGAPAPVTQPPQPTGEVEAVAIDGNDRVVVQTREPATLQMPELGVTIQLSDVSRADTGHAVFHSNSGAGIACASCHAEGHEDGRTWEFDCLGPRRTMSISGGIKTRAPYHWTGDLKDFPALMTDVYVGRMSGEAFATDVMNATLQWVDAIPRLPPVVGDAGAVTRGQALFDNPTHGCVSCHSGPNLSTNVLRDVGTGGMFKVPTLTGVAWRAPYMHDGCATTLINRFGACGGGDNHGVTSNLSSAQISDLVAYLRSL